MIKYGTYQSGDSVIRIFGLLTLFINHNLSIFTSNDEALSIYNNALNIKAFTRTFAEQHFVITRSFKKHNLTLICAHNQTAISHPWVASEVVWDVSLFFRDLIVGLLEWVVFLHSKELICVVTSNNHNVMIGWVEGTVKRLHVLCRADTLEREALLFVPVPQYDLVAVLTS